MEGKARGAFQFLIGKVKTCGGKLKIWHPILKFQFLIGKVKTAIIRVSPRNVQGFNSS